MAQLLLYDFRCFHDSWLLLIVFTVSGTRMETLKARKFQRTAFHLKYLNKYYIIYNIYIPAVCHSFVLKS